jgi:cell division protein FtsZ
MRSVVEDAIERTEQEPEGPDGTSEGGNGAPEGDVAVPRSDPETEEELEDVLSNLKTRIKVIGAGGAGTNTVARLAESDLESCELIAANTDAQHLMNANVPNKILMGRHLTGGLGAGSLPHIGEEAAKEAKEEIREQLDGADMVFVTCGLGGGTGTGSLPVIAKIARDVGALTIAVTTLPFEVEGEVRMENAQAGLERLRNHADTTIVIPNDKLLDVVPRLPLNAAFKVADELLVRSIRGITEMITKPGLVNLDFADLRTIMKKGGVAMIGLGESDSTNRAEEATEEALNSPLLDVDIRDAHGCLVNVVGGNDMSLQEAESVVGEISDRVNDEARIIWGSNVNPALDDTIRVMLVITGVSSNQILGRSSTSESEARSDGEPERKQAEKADAGMGIDFVL